MSTSNGSILFRGKVSKAALVREVYARERAAGRTPTVAELLTLVQEKMGTYPVEQQSKIKPNDVRQGVAALPRHLKGPLPVAAPTEAKPDRLAGILDATAPADSRLIPELRLAVRFLIDMGGDPEKAANRLQAASYILGPVKPS